MGMFADDECVVRWLGGLAESTRRNASRNLKSFFDFAQVSPGEAVEFQGGRPNDYRFVDKTYEWVENRGLRLSTMQSKAAIVRGFFLANRVPLPKDRHRFHSDKEPVFQELAVDEFRKILHSCNVTYRAAFMVQFQSGSGVGELLYINRHHADHVFEEVQKGSQIIRLKMPGRKSNRNKKPYYTFIGSDAVDCLKQLFYMRGWRRDSVLFRTEYQKPISVGSLQNYFRHHAIKTGVIRQHTFQCLDCGEDTVKKVLKRDGKTTTLYICTSCRAQHPFTDYNLAPQQLGSIRYRVRTHELRDLFRTQWHYAQRFAGSDADCSEFFMGHPHRIDPLKYDKIMRDVPAAKAEYRKAMPFLNVLTEDPRKIERVEVDDRFAALQREVAELKRLIREEAEWVLPRLTKRRG